MGRSRAAGGVVLLTMIFAVSLEGASASCAPPSVRADARRARPGDVLQIDGGGWSDTCDDTGGGSCSGSDPTGPDSPTQGIDVDLERLGEPGRERLVEDVDADDRFRIHIEVTVPDLAPGRYRIVVHDRGNQAYPPLPLRILRP